ncbi:MAG: site-specific DNA-methyltransferase [Gammaproteobacteria bacterium]|jgi:DNA modification methylase|nr:site-specific DNA-methyltransferase [Gammaproteobacteria bacterium]
MQIPEKYQNKTKTVNAKTGIENLPDESVDLVVTSPPYWGQRDSLGIGIEQDPREYLDGIVGHFKSLLPKLKDKGIVWLNLGDSYNTDINWRLDDYKYSTLGKDKSGHSRHNVAYTKKRTRRKKFIDTETSWLKQSNLLALPMRLNLALVDEGYFFRGEVIWSKPNAMPEGRCRRPHRVHEPVYLFSKSSDHSFSSTKIESIWEIAADRKNPTDHCSRFPLELPLRCIASYGHVGPDVLVLDPYSGSGTTGLAAKILDCGFVGFEVDSRRTKSANQRLNTANLEKMRKPYVNSNWWPNDGN